MDKANVLETSRLWREVVSELHEREFPHIQLEHVLVDNAAMQLVAAPRHFDVILTENMFGDILSDEAAMITGSIGLLPSASLGGMEARTRWAGSRSVRARARLGAGHRRGRAKANPLAMFLSAAMMLRHGLDLPDEAGGGRIGRAARARRRSAHPRPGRRQDGTSGRATNGSVSKLANLLKNRTGAR